MRRGPDVPGELSPGCRARAADNAAISFIDTGESGGGRGALRLLRAVTLQAHHEPVDVALTIGCDVICLARMMVRMEFYDANGFKCANGPALQKGYYCQKKLCFVATDCAYLVSVLETLLQRDDCFWVKYSPSPKDGMHLGRAFMTNPHAVGSLWQRYKNDDKLMCSVQDDDFVATFRSHGASSG